MQNNLNLYNLYNFYILYILYKSRGPEADGQLGEEVGRTQGAPPNL